MLNLDACMKCKTPKTHEDTDILAGKKWDSTDETQWHDNGCVFCRADSVWRSIHIDHPPTCLKMPYHFGTLKSHPCKLSRNVCVRCNKDHSYNALPAGSWESRGFVVCPQKEKHHRPRSIHLPPPDHCPYAIDHLMAMQEKAKCI